METSRVVAKNTFLLTLGLVVGRLLAFFVLVKMTPLLGPTGLGIWGVATDLTAILLVVANFGLGTLITREVTRARTTTLPVLWSALRVRWSFGAVCFLFLVFYVHLSGFDSLARAAILLTGIAIFVEATSMACDAILQAHEKVEYQAAGQIVSALVYFGLAFWWLEAGHGLMGVIWANLISRLVRLAIMAPLMLLKTGPWRWPGKEERAAGDGRPGFVWMMKLGLPLFLSTTFGILSFKVDVVMLTEMVGSAATGIYVLGHRALDTLMVLPNIFATALFPAMARIGAGGREDTGRMGERALRYMMIGVLPLSLLIVFVATPLIQIIDKQREFAASIPVLQIVIWGLPIQAANTIFNRVLIAAGRERTFVTIGLVTVLVNVVLNLFLIPRYSYNGAAAATLVSLSVSCVLHVFFIRRAGLPLPLLRAVGGSAAALVVAWLAAAGLAQAVAPGWGTGWLSLPLAAGWGPFLAVTILTAVLFLLVIFSLRVLTRDDLQLLLQIVKRGG